MLPIIIFGLIIFDNVYRELIFSYIEAIHGFQYDFSIANLLSIVTFLLILFGIDSYLKKDETSKNLIIRSLNTLIYDNSLLINGVIISSSIILILLVIHLMLNFLNTPELLVVLFIYYAVYLISLLPRLNKKIVNEPKKEESVFTEASLIKYYVLDDDQKRIVDFIQDIIKKSNENYLSIGLNGKWGSGKSSITNGLKDKFREYEYIEINLWNIPSPNDSVKELKNEISNFINKAFLSISNKELSYFNSFISNFNDKIGLILSLIFGYTTNVDSKEILESKISKTLYLLRKKKLIIIFDDIDRIPTKNINFYLKQIAYISELKNVISITNIDINAIENKIYSFEKQQDDKKINETINFLDKIFSVRVNTPFNHNSIRLYFNNSFDKWAINIKILKFEDAKEVLDDIFYFINHNPNIFESYREVKKVFNDLTTYFSAFNRQKIKIRNYIPTEIVFILTIVKYQFPFFYQKIIAYIQSHINEFSPIALNYIRIEKKKYDLSEFIRNNLFSGDEKKEDIDSNQGLSFNTTYLKESPQIQKLNNLINHAISKGLNDIIIAEKYITNKVHEYEITYEEIDEIKNNQLSVDEITKILFANDDLRKHYHPNYLSSRLISFIEKIKKVSIYKGNRLNAFIAIFNVYYFDKNSLETEKYLKKAPIEISEIFGYSFEIIEELNQIKVEDFDYDALFELWEKVINVSGGKEIFSIIKKSDGSPNKLGLLFSPRYTNKMIEIGSVFLPNRELIDELTIFSNEQFVISKILNHKFADKSFLKHLLLLTFYCNHELFGLINDKYSKIQITNLYAKLENNEYYGKILILISENLFGDLNEPGFYKMIEKYKYINNIHIFSLLNDLIYLNILARNDNLTLKYELVNFNDLFKQVLIQYRPSDIVFLLDKIINAIKFRLENKSLSKRFIVKIRKIFPELYSAYVQNEAGDKIEEIIKEMKMNEK